MPDLVGDLLCILENAGAPTAIAVGYVASSFNTYMQAFHPPFRVTRHDWGSQLAYEAARERPDIFTAVIGITIPVRIPPQLLR
jgi:soluble epoxide hydrolase/lipid-phosphate phosphatase